MGRLQARFGVSTTKPLVLVVCFLSPVLLAVCLLALTRVLFASRVPHGLRVGEVSVGGLDLPAFERALTELDVRLRRTPISVVLSGHAFVLDPENVGFRLDVSDTMRSVLNAGEQRSALGRVGSWCRRWVSPESLPARAVLDTRRLEEAFEHWEALAIRERPFEGGISVHGDELRLEPPRAG